MLKMLADEKIMEDKDENYNPDDAKMMAVQASFGKETDI